MNKLTRTAGIFAAPLLLALLLSLIYLVPNNPQLQESAISADLPCGTTLPGWFGERVQESKEEREALAADTRFSKAIYRRCKSRYETDSIFLSPQSNYAGEHLLYGPTISVSIVYSGSDMNSSIHRPERCLPSQGHQELVGEDKVLKLKNGESINFRRLRSYTLPGTKRSKRTEHIHYYVFVGHDSIQHTHLGRTFRDMWDRVVHGRVQRWAYFQIGAEWGGDTGTTEQEAEQALQEIIAELSATQINWNQVKN